MKTNPDRLFDLLPVVHRQRDAALGGPLRAVLAVISEQVELLEDDLRQTYDNWFIETCEDWVTPYLGDLIGYRPVNDPGAADDPSQPDNPALDRVLVPRRELANTIGLRRRRGTLALLESLSGEVAGWPARAVEFFRLLTWNQHVSHPRPGRGRTVSLRSGAALSRLGGPFDETAYGAGVRRIASAGAAGLHYPRSTALFVWPLQVFSITCAPARMVETAKRRSYTFSMLGHTAPLFTHPAPELEPTHIAGEINVPAPIRRRAFERRAPGPGGHLLATASPDYYGEGKSVAIWAANWPKRGAPQPVPAERVIPADLSRYHYKPKPGTVLVDPVLGRMEFAHDPTSPSELKEVLVSYYYGFSAAMGGGEYPRALTQPAGSRLLQVGKGDGAPFHTIEAALQKWREEREELVKANRPLAAVIEIIDSSDYTESPTIELLAREYLQLRAATGARPVLRLLDQKVSGPDALAISGGDGSRFTLDGLVVTANGLQVTGPDQDRRKEALAEAKKAREEALKYPTPAAEEAAALKCAAVPGDLCDVTIRHCTLVPGWELECDCTPCQDSMPSLELVGTGACVRIEHSILGRIHVMADAVRTDPLRMQITDSIWDAMSEDGYALMGAGEGTAHVSLTVARCTVLGSVRTHEIVLAEDSIFTGSLHVARRQSGCVRFCYVPPGDCTRTPRRYECQPDLVLQAAADQARAEGTPPAEAATAAESERLRVRPCFSSVRYGFPTYARLAPGCAVELSQGAQDRSEMGAFHDLFQPQRAANLRARLEEFTPAGAEAGLIFTALDLP